MFLSAVLIATSAVAYSHQAQSKLKPGGGRKLGCRNPGGGAKSDGSESLGTPVLEEPCEVVRALDFLGFLGPAQREISSSLPYLPMWQASSESLCLPLLSASPSQSLSVSTSSAALSSDESDESDQYAKFNGRTPGARRDNELAELPTHADAVEAVPGTKTVAWGFKRGWTDKAGVSPQPCKRHPSAPRP